MNLKQSISRHPLTAFFILAYLIPWVLWSYLIATTPAGMLLKQGPTPIFLIFAILGGFGPSLAAFVVAGVTEGRSGIKALLAGAGRWRFGIRWYLIALALVPLLTLSGFYLLAVLGHPVTLGDAAGRLVLGLVWPLFAALGEEFGWRGFALPKLQGRLSPAISALWIGLLWGMWHLPADYLGIGDQGWWFWLNFILLGPVLLTGLSVLMAWVYNQTNGSLAAMLLFHYSITFSGIVLSAQGLSPAEGLRVNAVQVLVVWIAAGLVLAGKRNRMRLGKG